MRILEKTVDDCKDNKEYLMLLAAYNLKDISQRPIFIGESEATIFDLLMMINEEYGFKHSDYREKEFKLPLAESDVDDAEPNDELIV